MLQSADFVERANGFPIICCAGSCPSLADLMGFVLVATTRRRQLVFGGMHPKVRDGPDAPFRFFFELSGAAKEIHGMLEAVMHVDVAVSRLDGSIEPFVFRYIRWDELMFPVGRGAGGDGSTADSDETARRGASHEPEDEDGRDIG